MAHGKKAYGEGLISKDRSQGILQTFAHFPHKKRRQGSKSGIAIFFMFVHVFYISAILYLSCHGGRVSKFCRSHFSEERQGG